MARKSQNLFDEAHVTELTATYHLLILINHRDKNQHCRNRWWKWFSILRRSVGNLLRDAGAKNESAAVARAQFIIRFVIPSCYLSFSQLAADSQFSALGLVLLAALAKIQKMVGDTNKDFEEDFYQFETAADEGIGSGCIEDLGKAMARPPMQDNLPTKALHTSTGNTGASISKMAMCVSGVSDTFNDGQSVEPTPTSSSTPSHPALGRKTQGTKKIGSSGLQRVQNAIDSMFDELT